MFYLRQFWQKILLVLLLAGPSFAHAQDFSLGLAAPNLPTAFTSVGGIISKLFSLGILIGAIVFVVLFLVGGLMYLTAAGAEATVTKAVALIRDGVIGLVIILISWATGNYVLKLLGVSVNVNSGTTTGASSTSSTSNNIPNGPSTNTTNQQPSTNTVIPNGPTNK